MNAEEAITICHEWFDYLERQEQKSKRLQELAALAKTGPEGHEEAKKELRRIDRTPTVYDGARLRPAVECLVKIVERDL